MYKHPPHKHVKKPEKHEKDERAQAAMEFLLTYGWAIILVLVVIAALAYFGVLSPSKLLPGRCQFQAGVDCVDYVALNEPLYSMEGYDVKPVTFNLINRLGKTVYIVGLEVEGEAEDYLCMEFKLDCEEGTDWLENSIAAGGLTLVPGNMCTSIRKICDGSYGLGIDCDPERILVWEAGSKLKAKIDGIISGIISPDYANFYCLNLPDKGERMRAQIIITYHEGDPSFTRQAYGELVTTVE